MENKPLSQEAKDEAIKRFITNSDFHEVAKTEDGKRIIERSGWIKGFIEGAKFGSDLRAERAKEKVKQHLADGHGIPELVDFNMGLETAFKAIEQSGI